MEAHTLKFNKECQNLSCCCCGSARPSSALIIPAPAGMMRALVVARHKDAQPTWPRRQSHKTNVHKTKTLNPKPET